MYQWVIFLHVLGAFGFMLGHGAAAGAVFRLKQERDRARIAALLSISRNQVVTLLTWISFLLFFISGIALGFMGRWWGKGWIWTALGILLVLVFAMGYYGRGYFDPLITALGLPMYEGQAPQTPPESLSDEKLEALLQAGRPWLLLGIGLIGWTVILWLMMFKPF